MSERNGLTEWESVTTVERMDPKAPKGQETGCGECEYLRDETYRLKDESEELQARARIAEQREAELVEKAAVAAWNHFMSACQKRGVNPSELDDLCAADAVRAILSKHEHNEGES